MARFPNDYPELVTLNDNDLVGGYETASVSTPKQRKITLQSLRTWLAQKLVFLDGIRLNANRIECHERIKTDLTSTGWYTVLESANQNVATASGILDVWTQSGAELITIDFGIRCATSMNLNNQAFKIVKKPTFVSTGINSFVTMARLVYGSENTGFKIQVKLDTVPNQLYTKLSYNFSRSNDVGALLVEPYLDNTPILPDGITTGSFLEQKEASGTQRELWTGPLSATGVTTSLNSGESFDDWNRIEIHFSVESDVNIQNSVIATVDRDYLDATNVYSDTGNLRIREITPSSFSMDQKTVSAGNIQRIIGVKL